MEIEIEVVGKGKAVGKLDDRNPETAKKIFENLPIEGNGNIYLEEIYFDIPLNLEYENPSGQSKCGDISYWPPGNAFCVFYGDSQPASEVNHIGNITENLEVIKEAKDMDKIIIRKTLQKP
ncbi:cyclophilin-like fold protein [Methanobacterium sp. ACI-7]|uniref:cyclophilin-like fold protein n=1 Tax=unclassified Methanobacterium TaxID=2627676 RepID=UPI0039C4359B